MKMKIVVFVSVLLLILTGCTKSEDKVVEASDINVENESAVVETEPRIENINISVTGDIMFHSTQLKAAYDNESKTYKFDSVFEKVKPYFEDADLAIANFETVTGGKETKYSGYPTFNTPENVLDTLKGIGIDILTTANNHCLDRRKEGLIKTIDEMDKRDIDHLGTYKNGEREVFVTEIDGINIGILSYTYGCNGMESTLSAEELNNMVNIINEDRIKNDIDILKSKNVDYIISFMHWGNEYNRTASEKQRNLADKMIAWGVDAILGSHPHVIQESEIKEIDGEKKLVVYSMGNFVSNQRRETLKGSYVKYTEDGVIINLALEKNFETGKTILTNVKYTPTWVNRYKENGKFIYDIIPIEKDNVKLYPNLENKLIDSYNNTMTQMMEY